MPLVYDAEYRKAIEPMLPMMAKRKVLTADNVAEIRRVREQGLADMYAKLPEVPGVEQTVHRVAAADGYELEVCGFVPAAKPKPPSPPMPAILHCHGGGYFLGSAQLQAKQLAQFVQNTAVPIFSVNYRLMPEYTGTTAVEDAYAALCWLSQNAATLGVDPARIGVFGESAGGGVAAGLALLARDRQLRPPLAQQLLVYPMLDDRTLTPNPTIEPLASWKTADNMAAWAMLLGDADHKDKDNSSVSPYVAPARAHSLAGLPPTYIDVGNIDVFRDEDITYATRLLADNVSVELHVYPGVPHGFDNSLPQIAVAQSARQNRERFIRSL